MSTVDQVFRARGLWRWYSSTVTNAFDGIKEKGQDYSTTFGTQVGVPVGGQVKRIIHNNNSIGDVVELMDASGAVWLYQHITARVRVGQALLTGDVIGTENGLPRDQYSTGPHIEVRYCLPGKWNPKIDSWGEPWVNPRAIFAAIGSQEAGTTGPAVATPQDQSLDDLFGLGGKKPTIPVLNLKPNASVKTLLKTLDMALDIVNPFDVQNVQQDNILGATFTDPFSWIEGFGFNLVEDVRGLLLRGLLLALGVFIVWRITRDFIDFGALASNAQALPEIAGRLLQ